MFISLDRLGKDFDKKPCALDDLTLDLPSGMIGLIGPNGAGKTTLMRILCGIVSPTRGHVLVDGRDIAEPRNRRALKKTLGYLPQDIEPYPNLTPPEFLDYVGILKGMDDKRERRRQADELIERVGLADVRRRRIGGFSGGMRRRVGIAQALMGDPRLARGGIRAHGRSTPEERMRYLTLHRHAGSRPHGDPFHPYPSTNVRRPALHRGAFLRSGRLAATHTRNGGPQSTARTDARGSRRRSWRQPTGAVVVNAANPTTHAPATAS